MSHIRIYQLVKNTLKKSRKNYRNNNKIKYNYNRILAKEYAQHHALNPNLDKYPLYKESDCTNFVCQALVAGGMKMMGGDYRRFTEWFCYTADEKNLKNTSLTWRSAQFFRMYWGNKDGEGNNMAREFKKMTVSEALNNFYEIYEFIMVGDVIQYGDINDTAYHSQIVHSKEVNVVSGKNDIFVAQHSANRKNVSLNEYLKLLNNKKSKYVYLYHF